MPLYKPRQDHGGSGITNPSGSNLVIKDKDGTVVFQNNHPVRGTEGSKFNIDPTYAADGYTFSIDGGPEYKFAGDGSQRQEFHPTAGGPPTHVGGKGSVGQGSGGVGALSGVAPGFAPGQVGSYGVVPSFLGDLFPSAALATPNTVSGVKYTPTDLKKFASEIGDFNRNQIATNSTLGKQQAFDQLDTELSGIRTFAPAATQVKQGIVSSDNIFNQGQRTAQVNATVPGVVKDLAAQRTRAQAYASGRIPDEQQNSALELGIRSDAADLATTSGFGASSSASRKISDLMSAKERDQLSQYGDQLLSNNDNATTNLFLAPTEFSDAGSQVRVTPSVSGSQLQQSNTQSLNQSTVLDPGQSLAQQIAQQQYITNTDIGVKQFNAGVLNNTDQFNVSNVNNFALSKFNYLVSYANSVAAAGQADLNTGVSLDQQSLARQEYNKQKGKTQQAGNIGSAFEVAGTGLGITSTIVGVCDQRLKEEIVPYTAGLAEITQLQPSRFRYIGHAGGPPTFGIMAQDLRGILPEAVQETEEGMLYVDVAAVIYALVNSVKELKAIIDGK